MKLLKIQKLQPVYYEHIQKNIEKYLIDMLYKPILKIVKDNTTISTNILNSAITPIEDALQKGLIRYINGIFYGKFNARIGKALRDIGAEFDKRISAYKIDYRFLPLEIKQKIEITSQQAIKIHNFLRQELDLIENNIGKQEQIELNTINTVDRINKDWQDTAINLIIEPELPKHSQIILNDEYNKSLQLQIKKWTKTATQRLRNEVEENAMDGYRYEELIDRIKKEFSISQNKAEFLARQETGLFMSKYRKQANLSVGILNYIWHARPMARPDHLKLNGRIFAYARPPITDSITMARNNPGEDYNCLCNDRAILGSARPAEI